jgi:hypothetical protein
MRQIGAPLAGAGLLGLALVLAAPASADDPPTPAQGADPGDTQAATGSAGSSASASTTPRRSKSGYDDPGQIEGAKGVGGQLVVVDAVKKPLIDFGLFGEGFYNFKRKLKDKCGIELNGDYNVLNQFASDHRRRLLRLAVPAPTGAEAWE